MYELKPCPFCGGEAKLRGTNIGDMSFYVVYCANKNCQVSPSSKYRRMMSEAIEAWNRRSDNATD